MKKLSSIQIFEDKQIENPVSIKGGADIRVDRTESNGWHMNGISTDPGPTGGEWDWTDVHSGWVSDHNTEPGGCTDKPQA